MPFCSLESQACGCIMFRDWMVWSEFFGFLKLKEQYTEIDKACDGS